MPKYRSYYDSSLLPIASEYTRVLTLLSAREHSGNAVFLQPPRVPGQRDCPRFLDELYRVCSTAGTTRLSEDTASELLVMCGDECELSIQLGIFEGRLGARPINVILGGIRL